jgi:transcriptional regulator with XRE-family HTH domain
MEPAFEVGGARVFAGDCREVLKALPDNSVDSIVTDPPYELGFMGKKWDNSGIAYDVTVWAQCLRVLKPGGHLLAFGGSRTWHRLAVAVEDAGFEIRDSIAWIYGSGFPKSLDVSKAIDKSNGKHEVDLTPFGSYVKKLRLAKGWSRKQLDDVMGTNTAVSWWEGRASGVQLPSKQTYDRLKVVLSMDGRFDLLIDWAEAEREVIGVKNAGIGTGQSYGKIVGEREKVSTTEVPVTAPATSEAKTWEGWGTALKPAHEPIVVGRKPLVGTVAENVLEWGVGGLNIDGSRIGSESRFSPPGGIPNGANNYVNTDKDRNSDYPSKMVQGRWPANVIFDEVTAGLLDEQSGISKSTPIPAGTQKKSRLTFSGGPMVSASSLHNDSGGASRFFYVAKASKRDRNEGLDDLNAVSAGEMVERVEGSAGMNSPRAGAGRTSGAHNFHPTVKPTALMRYLIKLVTPPGGTVLDPFTGSGSTGKAALLDGFNFVGVELTEEYLPIIEGRLRWATEQGDEDVTLF